MNEEQQQTVAVLVLRLRAMDEWEVDATIGAMEVISRELQALTDRTRKRIQEDGSKS